MQEMQEKPEVVEESLEVCSPLCEGQTMVQEQKALRSRDLQQV